MLDLLQDGVGDTAGVGVPHQQQKGSRLAMAAPAAVTMLRAPGPMDEVATMTWRRRAALA